MNFCFVVVFGNFVIFGYLLDIMFEFFVVSVRNFFIFYVVVSINSGVWVGRDCNIFVYRVGSEYFFVVFDEYGIEFFGKLIGFFMFCWVVVDVILYEFEESWVRMVYDLDIFVNNFMVNSL